MQDYTQLILTGVDSDGLTVTLELTGNENYSLVEGGYAPKVPRRRQAQLGGRGPYEDVEESCTINVYGDSAAEALAALDRLTRLLEQAQAFACGATVEPVSVQIRPQGSVLGGLLTSLIVGIPGDAPSVELPVTYHDELPIWEISNVTLHWKRRGPWLLTEFDTPNLVRNSSFEEWTAGTPDRWTALNAPSITQVRESPTPHHGTSAAGLENTSTQATRGLYQDVTGLTTSSTYTVSAWVYVVAGTMRLVAYDGGGVANDVTDSSSGVGWQRLSVQKVAPASGIRVTVAAYTAGAEGVFDAVMLELGSAATDYHLADIDYFENTQTGLGTAGASSRHTVSFEGGRLDVLSPLDITLGPIGPTATSSITVPGGYLLVASDEAHIIKLEAEDMTLSAGVTATVVAGASGGETARVNPSGNVTQDLTAAQVDGGTQLAIFAMVRKNTASDVWHIQARTYREGSNNLNLSKGGKVYLTDNAAEVIAVSLGVVSRVDPDFTLDISANRSSGTGYLDIDTIAILVLDDEASRAIALLEVNATEADSTSSTHEFGIRTHATDRLAPRAFVHFITLDEDLTYPGYRGDAFLSTKGDTVAVMWMGTDGNQWYHIDQSDGTAATLVLSARRYPAYLVPQ